MFLYHLNHSFSNQSIFSHVDESLTIGQCLTDDHGNYYLVLGTTIHRPHLYKISQAPAQLLPSPILPDLGAPGGYKGGGPLAVVGSGGNSKSGEFVSQLISTPTLNIIHHLVYEYYTTYPNILNLYLPNDIAKLIQKKPQQYRSSALQLPPQELIIMPDRRTIISQQEQYQYNVTQAIGSQHTINQDIKLFRNIKHGAQSTIICTPGECFWDYHHLGQITLVDPHKRYYKSQQEPRYDINRVCELMAHYYQCNLTIT